MLEAFPSPLHRPSDSSVAAKLRSSWGLRVREVQAFGSERNDTLLVSTLDQKFVVKLTAPSNNQGRLHWQLSLMEHVASKALPFATQAPIRTLSGELTALLDGHTAHLLPFLPGAPIRRNPLDTEGVRAVGAGVWQLQQSMLDYPGDLDDTHPWALQTLEVAASRLDAVDSRDLQRGCRAIIDQAIELTLPRLAKLPAHLTHNDVHTDNVLVEGQAVVGIVDWGDSVSQPHVADLAVAASYARDYHPMWLEGDPWQAAWTLRNGYIAAGGPDESADIFCELVLARLAQRIVLNLAVASTATDGGVYARRNMVSSVRDANDLFVSRADSVFPELGRDPLW